MGRKNKVSGEIRNRMNERKGILRSNYVAQFTVAPAALLATDIKRNGWAGTKDGQMYNIDSPGTVPANAVIRGGMAFSTDGALYTTTATPDALAVRYDGMVTRPDGAMYINKTVSGIDGPQGQKRNDQVWITT